MFHYLMSAKDPVTGSPALSRIDLLTEANLLVVAGADRTAVTLCGFFTKLNSCQYLRACIDEGLRMGPAGEAELNHVVLRGGQEVEG